VGQLGGRWATRRLLGGSATPGRLGCYWAARLLQDGPAATGRLGGCCWAARLGRCSAAAAEWVRAAGPR
ncbi:unnamed protein product, partial [Closterium sp. NIES-54]